MKHNDFLEKIDIVIFVVCLFLQNFAIITTEKFGISALVVFLIYVFFRYKMFSKINKKLIILSIVLCFFLIISEILNNMIDIMQIIRLYMIIYTGWSTIEYVNWIKENKRISFFYKVFYIAMICITIYGIYQIIAYKFNLPIILNVFNNNSSYGTKTIYTLYGGWSNSSRIYTTFFEPSVYSIFLVIAYVFITCKENISIKQKIVLTLLFIINLICTYSRSGWVTFVYFAGIFMAFKIFNNKTLINKLMKILIVILPIITLLIMSMVGLIMFDDESAKARTYSSLYYFENSFDSIKSIFVGHGLGSISHITEEILYNNYIIENFAHNGYVDIMYQLGITFLIILLVYIYIELRNNKLENNWLVFSTIYTISCFGTMFNVESIISLVCVVIAIELNQEQEKVEGKKNDNYYLSE